MQDISTLSFAGGRPIIPASSVIPSCQSCNSEMAFFFQVVFPADHSWSNHVLAVFNCISCITEDTLIPAMVNGPTKNARIPDGFLSTYQTNFRFIVAPSSSCSFREDFAVALQYVPLAKFKALQIGGRPRWYLEDETPQSYGALTKPAFLIQLGSDVKFKMLPSAKPQKKIDLRGKAIDSSNLYYELFLGNHLYFFGFGSPSDTHVYVLTQI